MKTIEDRMARRTPRPAHLWFARVLTACLAAVAWHDAAAQDAPPAAPAFSLASSQIFTSRAPAHVFLTFERVGHLDFRVYRIRDAAAFLAGLRDPHVLGSPEPLVAQEPTLIERLARWKARRRNALRGFLRTQVSRAYRRERSRAIERERLSERRTVRNYTQFAQVPVLNPDQLVSAWRELLPRTSEPDVRRVPLELPGGGVYLVEAVHERLRAYTVVAVADVGLLTKTAPGQMLTWAVHRLTGEPQANCTLTPLVNQAAGAPSTTAADGVATTALPERETDWLVTIARCGDQVALADPGGFFLRQPAATLEAYIYTDRPVYRPGHVVHAKAVLRWRERGLLRPFDRRQVEIVVADDADKVIAREMRTVDAYGAVATSVTLPAGAALGTYAIRVASGDAQASGSFEVEEYRKPEFEVDVTPAARRVLQGTQARVSFKARYYFGQPVAGGRVRYTLRRGYYYSPYRWVDESDGGDAGSAAFYGGDEIGQGSATLDRTGSATVMIPVPQDDEPRDFTLQVEARVMDESRREVSAATVIVAPWARFLLAMSADQYVYRPGG